MDYLEQYKVDRKMSDGWINQRCICDFHVTWSTRAGVSPVASCCAASNIFGYRRSLILVGGHLGELEGDGTLLICSVARGCKTSFAESGLRGRVERRTTQASPRPVESCSNGGHGQSSCRNESRKGRLGQMGFPVGRHEQLRIT